MERHGIAIDRHDLLRHEEGPGLVSLLRRVLFLQKFGGDAGAARGWGIGQDLKGQVEHEAGRMIVPELPMERPGDCALQAIDVDFHGRWWLPPARMRDTLAARFATMLRRWH